MRVIAGSKKGQPLQAVPGRSTRPTTDKVKESLFNLIGESHFNGGIGLDLYAGTGGLGVEALSRGLDKVIFVDQDRKAIAVIKQNLESTGFTIQSEIYKNDATRALKVLCKREIPFDLIFLDPPYHKQNIANELALFDSHQLITPLGMVIVETAKDVTLPTHLGHLFLEKQRQYGDTEVRIYRKESE